MNSIKKIIGLVVCLTVILFVGLSVAIASEIISKSRGKYDVLAEKLLQSYPLIDG